MNPPPKPVGPVRNRFRFLLPVAGLLVAGVFVLLLLHSVDPVSVGKALAQAHPSLLALGLLPLALGYGVRIARWRLLLLPANPQLRFTDCAVPLLGGFALNNVLPARAGDVVRVIAFQGRLGTGNAATAGSVVVERILDLLVLVGCLMAGLALVPEDGLPHGMRLIGGWVGGGILAGGAMVLLGAGWIRPWLERYSGGGQRLPQRVAGIAARVLLGMDLVRDPRRLAAVAALSLLVWAGEYGLYVCVERSLATGAGPAGALLAMAAGNLATLIPGTPGHVGTFHYFAAASLTAAGSTKEAALACALLAHLGFWGTTSLAGFAALGCAGWKRTTAPSAPTTTPPPPP